MSTQRPPDDVRREMRRLRRRFREDVEDVVESASELADWKSYVRAHPWVCLGAVAAVGYLMVPPRYEIQSPDADALKKLAEQNRLVVEANPKAVARRTWAGSAATFLGQLLVRQAIALAGRKLGALLAEHEQTTPSRAAESSQLY